MGHTVVLILLSPRANEILAAELAARSIPEEEYLSRLGKEPLFHLPIDMYDMFRRKPGIRAGRDYRVVRGSDGRIRKPRHRKVSQLVKQGVVSRGMPRKTVPAS